MSDKLENTEIHSLSRRRAMKTSLLAGSALVSGGLLAQGRRMVPAPEEIMGPYYPVLKPLDRDADLTRIAGRHGVALGQVIELSGRVLDGDGKPVVNAKIELWQANVHGRYDHPSDPNTTAPLDPGFQGYSIQKTDAWGRYRFRTIKPGAYPATPEWTRTPHIHFDVSGRADRLVTQLYFAGEPLNDSDLLFQALSEDDRRRVLVQLQPVPGTEKLAGEWDIILNNG
ncbi:protocatechuate 3,4-dioxygenase [Dyella sp. GSA-30]|uniref:protocatechuate 3,4-dioxygenase n=1 Tax=Dyella sp. GSA-30 TaxID=2994496 RepID=UPI0024913C40|nr:protocatechuate 3,4-dioxygenase [Dyella sp. GSA-30]BDU20340.1 protocatechuate 3,4-dioxygenase subunit beta [Dyella sp. GSA-30]